MNLLTEKFATKCGIAGLLVFMTLAAPASTVQFKPAQSYAVGTNPTALAIGDFNEDGNTDLAVLDHGYNVTMLLGKSDGTFTSGGSFGAGIPTDTTIVPTIVIGDFNGDGNMDLAVLVPPDAFSNPGEVHILMGNGDGTLKSPIIMTLEPNVTVVAVADFNGDKKADLVANLSDANGNATGIEVLPGNGDGTFQTPKTVVTSQEFVLTAADFNHDGKPDLAVSSSEGIQIMLGKGDGTFLPGGEPAVLSASATAAWTADLNNDNSVDLIVYSSGEVELTCGIFHSGKTNYNLSVLLGRGDGRFGREQIFATGAKGGSVQCGGDINAPLSYNTVGDLNGDGKLDILASTVYGDMFLGNGDGTFGPIDSAPASGVAADLNRDGLADLIALDWSNNSVDVSLNTTPAFSMTASANSITAGAGQQITDTLSVTGVNGFASTLQLSCQVTGPAPVPTCSLSPASISARASPSTSTLTISVPGTSASVLSPRSGLPLQPLYALALPVALVGLGVQRKRLDPRYKRWLLGASLATAALICTACGGGSSNTQSMHQPQSYTLQVTAASETLTKTMQIAITVQ
jgi:hypothetical protein